MDIFLLYNMWTTPNANMRKAYLFHGLIKLRMMLYTRPAWPD